MNYKMTVIIADPNTESGKSSDMLIKLFVKFSQDKNTYGNGYYVRIVDETGQFENLYDLRYLEKFDPNNKTAWLKEWALNYWNGKNGAYIVKSLTIKEA